MQPWVRVACGREGGIVRLAPQSSRLATGPPATFSAATTSLVYNRVVSDSIDILFPSRAQPRVF